MSVPSYKRIMIKISGEALMGQRDYGLDLNTVNRIAMEIHALYDLGIQLCLVVGGGNIFRGISGAAQKMDRPAADQIGMLATVMNALAMQNALEHLTIPVRVMSALSMTSVCEPYIRRRALRHLEKSRVLIFAAGTGNPYFTTDTAAVLRASEMNCDILIKGTKVDGVYSEDPMKNPDAHFYEHLDYDQVLVQNLKVMDSTAISLARENNLPLVVCSIVQKDRLHQVVQDQGPYTLIAKSSV